MSKFLWAVQLSFWLKHYGYCKNYTLAWDYANDESWQKYRDNFRPKQAVLEDLTYQ
jgi:hypothetical protein